MELTVKNSEGVEQKIILDLKTIQEAINTDEEAKKWHQAELDSKISKALNTYKENTIPKLLDDEVKKRFPEKSPEQLKMAELEQKIAQMAEENRKEKLNAFKIQELTSKQIPLDFKDFIDGHDEEAIKSKIDLFNQLFATKLTETVDTKFKENGRKVKQESDTKGVKKYTAEEIKTMSKDEFKKLSFNQIQI